jgi:hypothetical protein
MLSLRLIVRATWLRSGSRSRGVTRPLRHPCLVETDFAQGVCSLFALTALVTAPPAYRGDHAGGAGVGRRIRVGFKTDSCGASCGAGSASWRRS